MNVLRKQGYDVPQGYIGRELGDPRISTDVKNEEAIIDFLEIEKEDKKLYQGR
jgi:hypothetical protein